MHNDTTSTLVCLFFFLARGISTSKVPLTSVSGISFGIYTSILTVVYILHTYTVFFFNGDYAFTILGSLEAYITKTNSDLNVSIVQLK